MYAVIGMIKGDLKMYTQYCTLDTAMKAAKALCNTNQTTWFVVDIRGSYCWQQPEAPMAPVWYESPK